MVAAEREAIARSLGPDELPPRSAATRSAPWRSSQRPTRARHGRRLRGVSEMNLMSGVHLPVRRCVGPDVREGERGAGQGYERHLTPAS